MIDLPKVQLHDLLQSQMGVHEGRRLINIRGCNGAGKSTVPIRMLETDECAFEVVTMFDGKVRPVATVFPQYETVAIGHYHSKCGGMDSVKDTDTVKALTRILWNLDYDLLMEGILASTVRQTYIDLFSGLNESQDFTREIIIYNILPPLELCLSRIQERNGGKAIKEDLVEGKWNTVKNNHKYFEEAGFNSMIVSNEGVPRSDTLGWYYSNIGGYKPPIVDIDDGVVIPLYKPQKQQNEPAGQSEDKGKSDDEDTDMEYTEVYIEPDENLQEYDWYKDYKAPNQNLRMNKKYFDSYWRFISERMNIYYKRVVLQEPAPWTDDEILRNYKFTNVVRDMDRLSIYERNNILSKIDEPVKDLVLRKKSVLLNIMMFRLWVKPETYEVHGFIDLSDKHWKDKWEEAKKELLKRREQGISNFTAAFYVNDLHAANPDKETQSNKTQNAICMIEGWMDNIDDIYQRAIIDSKNMKEQLEVFKTLPCVGHFTAYEYACSITMITRYCKNHLVEWTQDNATNVGPGAKRGIDWIFENKGGLSDYQCILYLRSIWKHELQRLGTYERFIKQLPKELNQEIDLRVIEHCLCETQKYNKAWTNSGRPKESFTPRTSDVSLLKV